MKQINITFFNWSYGCLGSIDTTVDVILNDFNKMKAMFGKKTESDLLKFLTKEFVSSEKRALAVVKAIVCFYVAKKPLALGYDNIDIQLDVLLMEQGVDVNEYLKEYDITPKTPEEIKEGLNGESERFRQAVAANGVDPDEMQSAIQHALEEMQRLPNPEAGIAAFKISKDGKLERVNPEDIPVEEFNDAETIGEFPLAPESTKPIYH